LFPFDATIPHFVAIVQSPSRHYRGDC